MKIVLALFLAAVASLMAGLAVPGGVIGTGRLDPIDWLTPAAIGGTVMAMLLRRTGRASGLALLLVATAMLLPPLLLCVAGSAGQAERVAAWTGGRWWRDDQERPTVAVLSGPQLHRPAERGGFVHAPLWQALEARFRLRPIDALTPGASGGARRMLMVQPRILAPVELVALDTWVRRGGRLVLLVDPNLLWSDDRPIGHPSRAPARSMMAPLLTHWGLSLIPSHRSADPVERRLLDDGGMIQVAGAGRFRRAGGGCVLSEAGLVARCAIGRGTAVLIADADFANDALWTVDPTRPGERRWWTGDSVVVLTRQLCGDACPGIQQGVWLSRADGLPGAARPALIAILVACALLRLCRTKTE